MDNTEYRPPITEEHSDEEHSSTEVESNQQENDEEYTDTNAPTVQARAQYLDHVVRNLVGISLLIEQYEEDTDSSFKESEKDLESLESSIGSDDSQEFYEVETMNSFPEQEITPERRHLLELHETTRAQLRRIVERMAEQSERNEDNN